MINELIGALSTRNPLLGAFHLVNTVARRLGRPVTPTLVSDLVIRLGLGVTGSAFVVAGSASGSSPRSSRMASSPTVALPAGSSRRIPMTRPRVVSARATS